MRYLLIEEPSHLAPRIAAYAVKLRRMHYSGYTLQVNLLHERDSPSRTIPGTLELMTRCTEAIPSSPILSSHTTPQPTPHFDSQSGPISSMQTLLLKPSQSENAIATEKNETHQEEVSRYHCVARCPSGIGSCYRWFPLETQRDMHIAGRCYVCGLVYKAWGLGMTKRQTTNGIANMSKHEASHYEQNGEKGIICEERLGYWHEQPVHHKGCDARFYPPSRFNDHIYNRICTGELRVGPSALVVGQSSAALGLPGTEIIASSLPENCSDHNIPYGNSSNSPSTDDLGTGI